MIKNNNIVFVTPSLEKGGMERVIVELANYGKNHKYNIVIIGILPNREIRYNLHHQIQYISPKYNYKKGFLFKLRTLFFLMNYISKINPEVVLSFSETFNPLVILACKFIKIPVFISDRSNPFKKVSFFKRIQKKLLYPLANGMIAQTNTANKEFYRRKLNINIKTIPNPLKANNYIINRSENNDKKIIVSIGRLVISKNFVELIQIFSKVNKNGWQLWILGEGRERKSLEREIEKLNLKESIKLLGEVDEVDYFLSQASIFAFTSLSEGFPNALSEAMAFSLPCIAYDCPCGPADIINNNVNGFLIPLNDQEQFIKKLNTLMDNKQLRDCFVNNALENRNRFSANRTSKEYFKFILK